MNKKSSFTKKDKIKLGILIAVCLALLAATIMLMPFIVSLKDEVVRDNLREFIHSKGAFGVLILIGFQVLQVIVAVIPGEVVEVMSGLLYGTLWGYVICTIGMLIGTVIIYYTVKTLGYGYISRILGSEKLGKYKVLNEQKRLEMLVFILFFIPGTPKDILTYFIPFTKLRPMQFFIISTAARIPSIISSTFAGASIGEGKWLQTVIIFVVIGAIGILGIIFNEKLMKKLSGKKD